MKTFMVKIPMMALLIAILFSCSKSSNTSHTTCTATTGDLSPLTANQQVSYAATASGGATISSVSYLDSNGTTTVKNPTLPFSVQVNLKSGVTVTITATGTANSGKITVTSNGFSPNSASCP